MDFSRQQFFLLLLLLIFYCAPPAVILVWALSSIFANASDQVETGVLLDMLMKLAKEPGAYSSTIHQMIMPVVAAITAANYKSLNLRSAVAWLFILPLATIFVCVVDSLIFSAVSQLDEESKGIVSQFFLGIAGNLAVYVMLFVGLKMATPEPPANGEEDHAHP